MHLDLTDFTLYFFVIIQMLKRNDPIYSYQTGTIKVKII